MVLRRPLSAAALVGVRVVLERSLASHEPYPALVLDEASDILDANVAVRSLILDRHAPTPEQRANLIDLLMGPLRSALVNWHEVMRETRRRVRQEDVMAPHEPRLLELLARVELATEGVAAAADLTEDSPVMLTHVRFGGQDLSLLSTLVHFGATRLLHQHRCPECAALTRRSRRSGTPDRLSRLHAHVTLETIRAASLDGRPAAR